MSKNPNRKPNDNNNNDEDNNNDVDNETLRRGCYVKRRTRHVTRVRFRGGAWNWIFRAKRKYLDPKRKYPTISMVVYYCYLEVYIIRYMYRTGNNNTINISTNSNNSF